LDTICEAPLSQREQEIGVPTAALDGLVIQDFSRVLAGPYATMLLGDLGAEIIKVERPGRGDDTREWGPPWLGDQSTYFLSVNRNKRSVSLDLHDPDDVCRAQQLAAEADVVVENFKPGTFDRLGLGYEQLAAENEGLVYCSITGFGSGAGSELPGYDLLVQAAGGLMSVTGPAPGEPVKVGVALVDVITGLHAAIGILAALHHRAASGNGQRIEVNLLSSLLSGMVNQTTAFAAGGVVPGIMGNRHPSIAPYESYPTADASLVIAVGNDTQFRTCCAVLGRADWADNPRFATNPDRVRNRDDLYGLMAERLRQRRADEWFALLSAAGVPCGPINDVAGAVDLADRLGLQPVVEVGGVPTIANPITFSRTPTRYRSPPATLGQDTEAVLGSLKDPSDDH
jgi:crotonobetainyl-CoA:carnitine CoA-transferase CaiB-like acyl-CoA transferase